MSEGEHATHYGYNSGGVDGLGLPSGSVEDSGGGCDGRVECGEQRGGQVDSDVQAREREEMREEAYRESRCQPPGSQGRCLPTDLHRSKAEQSALVQPLVAEHATRGGPPDEPATRGGPPLSLIHI